MKFSKLNICLTTLIFATVNAQADMLSGCSSTVYKNQAPIVSNKKLSKNNYPLCFSDFSLSFSGISKTPLWAAEYVTPEILRKAKQISREDNFHEEEKLPVKVRSLLSDYRGSGYDRGHMVPNATRSSRIDQYQSFSLANIVPQTPKNNQEQWRNVEEATRTLITKHQEPAYMITGPLFLSQKLKKIGSGVLIPTHIYKVIYFPRKQIMGAYVSVNDNIARTDVVSVADLQKHSGIVFFPSLQGTSVLNQRYDLPLSANAAYKMTSLRTKAGHSNIFEIMPDESAQPVSVKQSRSNKKQIRDYSYEDVVRKVSNANKEQLKQDIKNINLIFGNSK